jgi:hypothetical protein
MLTFILFVSMAAQSGQAPAAVGDSLRTTLSRRTAELINWFRFWRTDQWGARSVPVAFAVTMSGQRAVALVPAHGLHLDFTFTNAERDPFVQVLYYEPQADTEAALHRLYEDETRRRFSWAKDNRFTRPGEASPQPGEFITSASSARVWTEILPLGKVESPPASLQHPGELVGLFQEIMLRAVFFRDECGPTTLRVPRFRESDPEILVAVHHKSTKCADGVLPFTRATEQEWLPFKTFRPIAGQWSGIAMKRVLENTLLTIQVP